MRGVQGVLGDHARAVFISLVIYHVALGMGEGRGNLRSKAGSERANVIEFRG